MLLRLLLGVVFLSTMAGCASTQASKQMELRIGELEREVAQRDDEIADLQDEVDGLKGELKRKKAPVDVVSGSSGKYGEIIRVNATPGQVQIALKKAGYYSGSIDGKIGSGTKNAIMAFQKDNGLKADGVVGRQTWEKLQTFVE